MTDLKTAVQMLSRAIAHAEGFFVHGSLPQHINNPGDLERGNQGHGVHNGKTIYATPEEGWAQLEHECTLILTGQSHYIKPAMTFDQMAAIYTGNDHAKEWAMVVAKQVGLKTTDKLSSLHAPTPPPQKA